MCAQICGDAPTRIPICSLNDGSACPLANVGGGGWAPQDALPPELRGSIFLTCNGLHFGEVLFTSYSGRLFISLLCFLCDVHQMHFITLFTSVGGNMLLSVVMLALIFVWYMQPFCSINYCGHNPVQSAVAYETASTPLSASGPHTLNPTRTPKPKL